MAATWKTRKGASPGSEEMGGEKKKGKLLLEQVKGKHQIPTPHKKNLPPRVLIVSREKR
jgi:hypothetical protein